MKEQLEAAEKLLPDLCDLFFNYEDFVLECNTTMAKSQVNFFCNFIVSIPLMFDAILIKKGKTKKNFSTNQISNKKVGYADCSRGKRNTRKGEIDQILFRVVQKKQNQKSTVHDNCSRSC